MGFFPLSPRHYQSIIMFIMRHMILGNFHLFNCIQMNVTSKDVAKLAFKILEVCYGKKDVDQVVSSILLFWKILCF